MNVYKLIDQNTDSQPRNESIHTSIESDVEYKNQTIHDAYLKYHEELCRTVIKKFDISRSEAEDVVQTAFIRYAESFVTIKNPRAFLYKTCSNIEIDRIRRRQVQRSYEKQVIDSDAETVEDVGPERLVAGRQRLSLLSQVLWAMPSKRRQLLMMSRFDGLSYAEIARRVNLSETVVRRHIARALAGCQKAMQSNNT